MSDIDNTFERLMNIMALKYDRGVVRGKRKDHWFVGEPVSDEWFLEAMAEIAPVIIDKWWRYLDADGDLNLDEAMFGKGGRSAPTTHPFGSLSRSVDVTQGQTHDTNA